MITIHTDGSSLGNPGPTGWGIILTDDDYEAEYFGGQNIGTNNIGELTAVIVGLELITEDQPIKIRTDSKYVIDGASKWLAGWVAKGWKKSDGKPVANKELWQRYLALSNKDISFEWVKGHSNDPYNERCDALAKRGAKQYQ